VAVPREQTAAVFGAGSRHRLFAASVCRFPRNYAGSTFCLPSCTWSKDRDCAALVPLLTGLTSTYGTGRSYACTSGLGLAATCRILTVRFIFSRSPMRFVHEFRAPFMRSHRPIPESTSLCATRSDCGYRLESNDGTSLPIFWRSRKPASRPPDRPMAGRRLDLRLRIAGNSIYSFTMLNTHRTEEEPALCRLVTTALIVSFSKFADQVCSQARSSPLSPTSITRLRHRIACWMTAVRGFKSHLRGVSGPRGEAVSRWSLRICSCKPRSPALLQPPRTNRNATLLRIVVERGGTATASSYTTLALAIFHNAK